MGAYLARRIVISIPVLLGITLVAFTVLSLAPGDPIRALIDPETLLRMTPQQLEDIALAVPEADRVFVVSGSPTVSQGRVILRVKAWDDGAWVRAAAEAYAAKHARASEAA